MFRRSFTLERPQTITGTDGVKFVRTFRASKERWGGTMVVPLGGCVLKIIFDEKHNLPPIDLAAADEKAGGVSSTLTILNNRLAKQALRDALEGLSTAERGNAHGNS